MSAKPSIAILIPAFNEAPRIGAVLEPACAYEPADEILVVDDGSTDGTADAVAAFERAKLIRTPRNLGKGGALQVGLDALDADIVCMIDADLLGLTAKHLDALISPLLENSNVTATLGYFSGGRKRTDWAQQIARSWSGQRAVRREFYKSLPDLTDSRYGVEMIITKHAKTTGANVTEVALPNVTQVMREEKVGVKEGLKGRVKMYANVARHGLPKPSRKSLPKKRRKSL